MAVAFKAARRFLRPTAAAALQDPELICCSKASISASRPVGCSFFTSSAFSKDSFRALSMASLRALTASRWETLLRQLEAAEEGAEVEPRCPCVGECSTSPGESLLAEGGRREAAGDGAEDAASLPPPPVLPLLLSSAEGGPALAFAPPPLGRLPPPTAEALGVPPTASSEAAEG